MDRRDEELTLANVDEQIEQYLAPPQANPPPAMTSLTHVVRDLQSIYEEERLVHVWARINANVSAVKADNTLEQAGEQPTIKSAQGEKTTISDAHAQSFSTIQHRYRSTKQSRQSFHRKKWYGLGVGLVAAIMLVAFFTWPILSYALRNTRSGNAQIPVKTVTSQVQPTVNAPNMKEYISQHFKIQYPADWVIISTNTGSPGSYLQRVQFRPSATSPVFVNVDMMPNTTYSTEQLLHMDPDAKLGTLNSTSTITYNERSWVVGIVELADSAHVQTGKLEIAYSTQDSPYRIEFGATPGMFNSYMKVFNAMFASFSASKIAQKTTATVTPTLAPTVRPIATPLPTPIPSPTIVNVVGIKVYSSLYFTIQYPANWVITSVTTGGTYQQTVQFRPSATSSIFVNVNVLYSSGLSSALLLLIDPEVKLGTLLSTNTVTYNGLPWTVGILNLLGSGQVQPSEEEIAYSNQNAPYKIELSAPHDKFSSYTQVFNTMLASFSPAS